MIIKCFLYLSIVLSILTVPTVIVNQNKKEQYLQTQCTYIGVTRGRGPKGMVFISPAYSCPDNAYSIWGNIL